MHANVLTISICLVLLALNSVALSKLINRQTSSNRLESERGNLRAHHRANKADYRRSPSRLNRNTPQRFKNCAIMYRNQEPVGILQPFEKSFKLLPVRGEKIFLDMDEAGFAPEPNSFIDGSSAAIEEKSSRGKFSLEEYPSIFTKFKINTKLADHQRVLKRDLQPAVAAAGKIDKSQIVEEQLKNILNEMGLIEPETAHEEEKRAAEDENLEFGTNKLNLVKEEKIREARDASAPTTDDSFGLAKRSATISKDSHPGTGATTECSAFSTTNRRKRQNENANKQNSAQISSESKSRRREKKTPLPSDNQKSVESETDKSANLDEYEKRVEREIKDKIKALKEEVKREIQKEKELLKSKDKRRKRQVNSLEEEETKNLDPNLNLDQKLVPHIIRKRRSLNEINQIDESKDTKEEETKNLDSNLKDQKLDSHLIRKRRSLNEINQIDELSHSEEKIKNLDPNSNLDQKLAPHSIKNRRFLEEINQIDESTHSEKEETKDLDPNLEDQKLAPHLIRNRRSLDEMNQIDESTHSEEKITKDLDPNLEEQKLAPHLITDRRSLKEINQFNGFLSRKLKEYPTDNKESKSTRNRRDVDASYDNIQEENEAQFNEGQSSCTGSNCPNTGQSGSSGSHCTCDSSGHCSCGSGFREDKSEASEESDNEAEYDDKNKFEDSDNNNNSRKKRRSILIPVYEEETGSDYAENYDNNNYELDNVVKRQADYENRYREDIDGARNSYFVDMHPNIFRLSPETRFDEENAREKRQSFEKGLSAIHGGGPIEKHLVAIRSRSMAAQPHSRIRRRVINPEQPKQLIDMSDEELFGALPQSFEGELSRYKRVKRTEDKPITK